MRRLSYSQCKSIKGIRHLKSVNSLLFLFYIEVVSDNGACYVLVKNHITSWLLTNIKQQHIFIVCMYRSISIKHNLPPEKYNQKHLTVILGNLSLTKQIIQGAIKRVGYWALHIEVEARSSISDSCSMIQEMRAFKITLRTIGLTKGTLLSI